MLFPSLSNSYFLPRKTELVRQGNATRKFHCMFESHRATLDSNIATVTHRDTLDRLIVTITHCNALDMSAAIPPYSQG
eukprot:1161555-Pelagomonas_calceolata.AAC.16